MEAVLIAINKILDIKLVQWALLVIVATVIPFLSLKMYWYKYDNALLRSTAADLGSAIQIQNRAIQEVGREAQAFKENYEQKNKEAAKIALEGQKTLQKLLDMPLSGTCDEKVKQAASLVKGAIK